MELKHIAARDGRLSSLLREEMAMSSGLVNRLKWHEKICVNGNPEHTDFFVRVGDEITVFLDAPQANYAPEQGKLNILYEDEHLLAVDKPAGMLIHPSRVKNEGTLANYIAGYYEKTGQNCAFHPVTRLDRDTFGIVLLAKNAHIHARLQAEKPEKIYHALVLGAPKDDCGMIDAPIARRPLPSLLRYVGEEGKPCVTEYRRLHAFDECSILELRPITGRTHQLRVHCAHMGFPILGDPQYGNDVSRELSERMGLTTQQLCAYSLRFAHPVTGEQVDLRTQMRVKGEDSGGAF